MAERPAAVLFDIDGTLAVGSSGHLGALARAARATLELAVEFDVSGEAPHMNGVDVTGWIDAQLWRTLMAAAGEAPDDRDRLAQLVGHYTAGFTDWLESGGSAGTLVPGARETVLRLRDAGTRLALVTGNVHGVARAKLERLSLDEPFAFDPDAGFGDWRADRAELVPAALERLAVGPTERSSVALVGDTAHDMAAARAAGLIAVGVTTGARDATALRAAGATLVVESVARLGDLWT